MFDYRGAKNIQLKTLELFEADGGRHYLRAIYQYETNRGVYELVIPKIFLPVLYHNLPKIINEGSWYPTVMVDMGFGELEAINITCTEIDSKNKINYYVRTIEEKVQTLTLSEIEQRLGYKINLVSEKEE